MVSKSFSLGSVLTVTTGAVLTDDIGDLYKILNYMTGDNLFTHQLIRAGDVCKEPLLAQHPQLRAIEVPTLSSPDEYRAWLSDQEKVYGAELSVEPLESWRHRNPISELIEMREAKEGARTDES